MKRLISPLSGIFAGLFFLAVPGFSAVTGLTAYPGSVTYQASSLSTLVRTDSSPIVVASGTGSASVTVAVSSPTLNVSCGGSTKPWLSATPGNGTINAGGYVGVTILVNPCGGNTDLSGTVKITAGSASTSISVTLHFSPGVDATVTNSPAMPAITHLAQRERRRAELQNCFYSLRSGGLFFSVSPSVNNGVNWLNYATNGDSNDFIMIVDASKLSPGDYSGFLNITGSAKGSPINAVLDVTLIVPVPIAAITSLNPNSATSGGGAFTLTVTGSGFANLAASTIDWNGAPLTTTYVSATQLTAPVSASLIASSGTASVTVVNTGASYVECPELHR